MNKLIKFDPGGVKGLHFFTKGINYPILIATYSNQEEYQVSILEKNYQNQHFNSEQIAKWCICHNIKFQFLYPIKKISIIKNPYKYIKFKMLIKKLK